MRSYLAKSADDVLSRVLDIGADALRVILATTTSTTTSTTTTTSTSTTKSTSTTVTTT